MKKLKNVLALLLATLFVLAALPALAASYVQNSGIVTPQGIINGDMNGDGAITAADLAALYSLILG